MLGFEFETKSDPFAAMVFLQGLSVFIFDNLAGQLEVENKFEMQFYLFTLCALSLISTSVVAFFPFRRPSLQQPFKRISFLEQISSST